MSLPISLEMHIPATAMNLLKLNGSTNVGNIRIRVWDGHHVRLFWIADLESANLVHTLQQEVALSISDLPLSEASPQKNQVWRRRLARLKRRSTSRTATRSTTKATS